MSRIKALSIIGGSILAAITWAAISHSGSDGQDPPSKEDIEAEMDVQAAATSDYPMTIHLGAHDVLQIEDTTGDGRADRWTLKVDGVTTCIRWSRQGYDSPDAGELFSADGKSRGVTVWGHFREDEAEGIRKSMEKEIESKKHH